MAICQHRATAIAMCAASIWRTTMLLALLGTAFQLVVVPIAQAKTPATAHAHSYSITTPRSCGKDFASGHTFRLGRMLRPVNVPVSEPLPRGTVYLHLKQGSRVIIAGDTGASMCVERYDGSPGVGWVSESSVRRLPRPKPASMNKAWSGVWVSESGDWLTIRTNDAHATIIDGRACWAQCDHYGFLSNLVSLPTNSAAVELKSKVFFGPRFFTFQKNQELQGGGSSNTDCRFYANLLSREEMIVSDEHGSCGGLDVTWTEVYFKVAPYPIAPYPPYAKMKAYFKAMGEPFMTLPDQQRTRCDSCPYGAKALPAGIRPPFFSAPPSAQSR